MLDEQQFGDRCRRLGFGSNSGSAKTRPPAPCRDNRSRCHLLSVACAFTFLICAMKLPRGEPSSNRPVC
jgi:hypothetical protein